LPFEHITSRDNRQIKTAVKLMTSGRFRKEHGLFVLEGMRLCTDALRSGVHIDSLFFTEQAERKYCSEVRLLSNKADKIYLVDDSVFMKLTDTVSPQGIVCICRIVKSSEKLDSSGRYVACENLSDPSNLGAIARTAEALAADGLILLGNCCDPYSPKAQRAAMGSLLRLPVVRFDDAADAVLRLRSDGLRFYAAVVDEKAEKIGNVKFQDGDVVLIGNEGNGLTGETIAACDYSVTIPIRGRAESFNAAAAAAILLWELLKP
jgi:TrmH family RNA methyltransferase